MKDNTIGLEFDHNTKTITLTKDLPLYKFRLIINLLGVGWKQWRIVAK